MTAWQKIRTAAETISHFAPDRCCLVATLWMMTGVALAPAPAWADTDAVAPDPVPEQPAAPAASGPAPPPPTSLPPPVPAFPNPTPTPAPPPPPPPPPVSWKANAEVGFIQASSQGDTTENFKGKLHWEAISGNWANEFNIDALTAHDDNSGDNTERYIAGTKSKRSMTHLDYLFMENQWLKDGSSIYNYQAFTSFGYGRYLIKTDTQQFNMEVGTGFRHSEPNAAPATNDEIGNFNTNYHWQIKPGTSLGEKIEIQDGRENLTAHSVTEIKQNISAALACSISYDYSHDSGGPGTTDRITSINLLYQFR